MKDFSIIIPVYNTESSKLRKCFDSVVTNNKFKYEIIIVDDGSSNIDTLKELKLLSTNPNVKLITIENSGSALARNFALDASEGKYILFLDSDDCIASNFWEQFSKHINKEVDVCLFNYMYSGMDQPVLCSITNTDELSNINHIYSNILLNANYFPNYMMGAIWGKCFLRTFLEKNNIRFKPEIRKSQDRMFMLEVFCRAVHVSYLPIHEYNYFLNNGSITHKYDMRIINYYYNLYVHVENFIKENKIDIECQKLFVYGIINEMLPLTVFNRNNDDIFKVKKDKIREIYKMFSFDDYLAEIDYGDMYSFKSKIKLFLFKKHMIFALNRIYLEQQ